MTPTRGIVFATTTPYYTTMARKAARNLRRVEPDLEIDLFTDQPISDPVFARIIPLKHTGTRPKMEAMRRSRFDLTFALDSDVIAIAPFQEVFELLATHDFALRPGNVRFRSMDLNNPDIPRAFPLYNSGVMGVRKSPDTDAFLQEWDVAFSMDAIKADQRSLRRLLWGSPLRVCPLPIEYNLSQLVHLLRTGPDQGAPRLLHIMQLDKIEDLGDPELPFDPFSVLPEDIADRVRWLLASDYSLGGR